MVINGWHRTNNSCVNVQIEHFLELCVRVCVPFHNCCVRVMIGVS